MRILLLSFLSLLVFVGCAGQEQKAGGGISKKPLVSATEEQNEIFQGAVSQFYEADWLCSRAIATAELKEKASLLDEAAHEYEQILNTLAELRPGVNGKADRKRIDSLIEAAQLGQRNACDSLPVIGR
jgi:hypothetical protein